LSSRATIPVRNLCASHGAEAVGLEVFVFNDSAFYAALGFEPLRLCLEQGL